LEGTRQVNGSRAVQRLVVTGGDTQVASQVGLHLLGEIADGLGLTSALSAALPTASGHDRGRLFAQTAVMLAGGGECVADMAALWDQPALFGEVASGPTIWRAFHEHDEASVVELASARAAARARFWSAAGAPDEVVLDIDAALVEVHATGKEAAASHFKGGFGFHPMFCFADHSGEALAGLLRLGNATANDAADQLTVIDAAIAQLPAAHRAGHRVGDDPGEVEHRLVVRADTAGAVAAVVHGSSPATSSSPSLHGSKTCCTRPSGPSPPTPGSPPSTSTARRATPARSPSSTSCWPAGPKALGPSAAATNRIRAPSCGCGTTTAGAIR
jgi:hypothetical protein